MSTVEDAKKAAKSTNHRKKLKRKTALFTLVLFSIIYLGMAIDHDGSSKVMITEKVFTGKYTLDINGRLSFINEYVKNVHNQDRPDYDQHKTSRYYAIEAEEILKRQCGIWELREVEVRTPYSLRIDLLRPFELLGRAFTGNLE